jgi:hypothetical protein
MARARQPLLDGGSGLGGPARYSAARFGCRVSGSDPTEESSRGAGGELDYPTSWPANAQVSFLASPQPCEQRLCDAGFEVLQLREKAPHPAALLVHGELAPRGKTRNAESLADGRAVPIEVLARKPALRQFQDAKA